MPNNASRRSRSENGQMLEASESSGSERHHPWRNFIAAERTWPEVELAEHAAESHGIANLGRAVTSIPTLDAASSELIAVSGGAVRFFTTLHATAAVTRAQAAGGGADAFSVFVALVANLPSLIAAVGASGATVVI